MAGGESGAFRAGRYGDGTASQTNATRVLVAGRSRINRVVVSKIVERAGLKPISESPETAEKALLVFSPIAAIFDGGADDRDCDALLPAVMMARQLAGGSTPSLILLSNRTGTVQSLGLSDIIDAVVAKPITPERLQPVIERLVGHCRR